MYLSGQPLHRLGDFTWQSLRKRRTDRCRFRFRAESIRKTAPMWWRGSLPVTVVPTCCVRAVTVEWPNTWNLCRAKFAQACATTIAELVEKRRHGQVSLTDYAQKVVADPRYAAAKNQGRPRRVDSKLWMFDCLSCDSASRFVQTTQTLPSTRPRSIQSRFPMVLRDKGTLVHEPADHLPCAKTSRSLTLPTPANECGNCDIFCPEWAARTSSNHGSFRRCRAIKSPTCKIRVCRKRRSHPRPHQRCRAHLGFWRHKRCL